MQSLESVTQQQLYRLEKQRYQYLLASDTEAYAGLCHPDLTFVHSTGAIESRESFLEPIRSGEVQYLWVEHPIRSIVVAGATAVILGDVHAELRAGGARIALKNQTLATWVFAESKWLLLSHVGTAVS